jgi:hypothetical protein
MSKSQFRTMMLVLCFIVLGGIVAGNIALAAETKAKDANAPAAKAAEKPAPAVKPAAATAGPTLGPFNLAKNWAEEQGFVANWLICGVFPNPGERPDNTGFTTDYLKDKGGEDAFVPANGMEIKDPNGKVLKFQPYHASGTDIIFGDVNFLGIEPTQEKILTYCACWLDSDADKDVEIRVGSDDGYKLWLNHKLIATVHEYRAMEMDQETHKVKLNKGKNLILIKVDQDTGEYQFMLRVVGSDGKAAPGVTVWN